MPGMAVLSVWDGKRAVDIEVSWDRDYDEDARVMIPKRFEEIWKAAGNAIRRDSGEDPIEPYATLPVSVSPREIFKSASGAYAIAQEAFGKKSGWRIPPPYPELNDDLDERVKP